MEQMHCEQISLTPTKRWLLLVVLSYTSFIFNTTEFIPIGLLSDIATAFRISETTASLLISAYAWFVALMSLPLMLIFGKRDFRKMLLAVLGCFVVSHMLSAVASSFAMLLISRLGVACSHAVFWSIISPLAVHIAPEGKKQTAMGMIITGTSLAMIIGMPLGRVIGLHLGWRYSFAAIGLASFLSLVLLSMMFPPVPNRQECSSRSLPALSKLPVVTGVYAFTILAVTAHYMAYSYIEPFLKQVAGMTESMTTSALVLFGFSGIIASVLFSKYYGKHPKSFLFLIPIGLASILITMELSSVSLYGSLVHCVCWGLMFTAFNLVTEYEVIRHSPPYTTIAVALYSSIFNIGIGCGAFLGGMVLAGYSISYIGYAGSLVAILALPIIIKRLAPNLSNS